MKKWIVILLIQLSALSTWGHSSQRYPVWATFLKENFLLWTPTGTEVFTKTWAEPLLSPLRFLSIDWDLKDHAAVHPVMWQLKDGHRLAGKLFVQPTTAKRPLVIFRSGIFSNIDELYGERAFLIELFEKMGAHVLVVENMTSSDYLTRNHQIAFGGFDEGLQNIWMAEYLNSAQQKIQNQWKMNFSEIHLVGVSLGGQSVLWNSRFDYLNQFKSFAAFCPVGFMQPTLNRLALDQWDKWIMGQWARQRIGKAVQAFPEWSSISEEGFFRRNFFSQLQELTVKSYRPPAKQFWPAFMQKTEIGKASFFHLNQLDSGNPFWGLGSQKAISIWVNEIDGLVSPEDNAFEFQKTAPLVVSVIKKDLGTHCTFLTSYSAQENHLLFREHFKQNSNLWSERIYRFRRNEELAKGDSQSPANQKPLQKLKSHLNERSVTETKAQKSKERNFSSETPDFFIEILEDQARLVLAETKEKVMIDLNLIFSVEEAQFYYKNRNKKSVKDWLQRWFASHTVWEDSEVQISTYWK